MAMPELSGGMEDIGVSASALDSLERNFQEVIKELGAQDNIERFRLEYEKLHRALKKSHESEKRLIKKCQELNQEIMNNAAKVQHAMKLSHEDEATIESLKKEIEKAWKMVDAAHEKESRSKETIQQLKREVATLSHLVEQGATLTSGHEISLQDLNESKKELIKERDALNQKIIQQTHDLRELTERVKRVAVDNQAKEEDQTKLNEKLARIRREVEKEQKNRERAEGQIKELTGVLQSRTNECDMRKVAIKQKTDSIDTSEKTLHDEFQQKQLLSSKLERNTRELANQKKVMDDEIEQTTQYAAQITELQSTLEVKEAQLVQLRHQQQKLIKSKDTKHKALKKAAQDKDDVMKERVVLEQQVVSIKKQIDINEKELGVYKDKIQSVTVDQAQLEQNIGKEKKKQEALLTDAQKEALRRHGLEEELVVHTKSNHQQRKQIYELEKHREKYAGMASEATARYQQALEDVKIGLMKLEDLQKQIEEAEKRTNQQQSMYEQVRSDRNLYSKNLIEAQDEISEMKRKFKIMDHQIDQLKEELSMKEKKYFEAQTNHKTVSEKLAKMRKQVNYFVGELEKAKSRNDSLTQEIRQLTKIIDACDAELNQQQQLFSTVTNERDILGTQLIRRNDELALLYEKIRIQQSTLSKGEIQYRDRLVDIRMLRLKIQELKRNLHMTQSRVRNIEELKKQITSLQRQLHHERHKVQALSEELENPQNIPRWRKLKGDDPKEFEMVQKIQTLQKRLIAKTEECVEKDIIIQEREKLYIELKTILSRQPGPEVAEQLNIYHANLRRRNVQMKCVASELNMASTQSSEYKYEAERLSRELQEMKKRYFELKMNNQMLMHGDEPAAAGHGATE